MAEVDVNAHLQDFIASGRTGRRNAVPDIIHDGLAKVSTSDLPYELEKLKCSDEDQKSGIACAAGPSTEGGNTDSKTSS